MSLYIGPRNIGARRKHPRGPKALARAAMADERRMLNADATAKGEFAKLTAYNQGYRGKQLTAMKELILEADPSAAAQKALYRIRAGQKAARTRKLNEEYGPVQGPVYRKTNRKVGQRHRKRVPKLKKRSLPKRTPLPTLGNQFTVGNPYGIMHQNFLTPAQVYPFL